MDAGLTLACLTMGYTPQTGSSAGARRFPQQGSQRLAGWVLAGDLGKKVGMDKAQRVAKKANRS